MIYSAGILLWRYRNDYRKEYFVVSPGGPLWKNKRSWGPPKGQMEENENPFEAAVREFHEETGVLPDLSRGNYTYHGPLKQRKDKVVHIFSRQTSDDINPEYCESNLFTWIDGKEYPEIGHYAWLTIEEIGEDMPEVYRNLIRMI